MSWRNRLSSLLKEAIVPKIAPVQPRTDKRPSYVRPETTTVTAMKNHRNILEVENKLVTKRPAATPPRQAAVQWPRHIKCREIKTQEISKQLTIYSLFLNWNEAISLHIATPIKI